MPNHKPDPNKVIWGSTLWAALTILSQPRDDEMETIGNDLIASLLLFSAAQELARDPTAAAWAAAATEEARRTARQYQRL